MKTIELRDSFGIDSLVLGDRPMPTPGAGEILLKVNAAYLNYRDLLVVNGTFFPNLQFPFVPTSDAAGRIEQVGSGVTKFKPGDRATTHFIQDWERGPFNYTLVSAGYLSSTLGGPLPGVLSEYVVLPERGVVATPSYLSDEEAATLPIAGLTAWESFRLDPCSRDKPCWFKEPAEYRYWLSNSPKQSELGSSLPQAAMRSSGEPPSLAPMLL